MGCDGLHRWSRDRRPVADGVEHAGWTPGSYGWCVVKVVGYIRVSTDRQAEHGFGLDVQETAIREWARANKHIVVTVYTDAGVSGSNGVEDRVGLPDALNALEDHRADGIVIARMDRLARKLVVQEAVLARVWDAGAHAFEVGSGLIDPADDERTFIRQLMGAMAQLDKARTLRRLNAGRAAKRKRDGWAGGMVPYGYRIDPDTKTLVPEPAEQRALVDARRMRAQGKSWRTITAYLNWTMGGIFITPPRRGAMWYPMSVKRIVEREATS